MKDNHVDWTLTFRRLGGAARGETEPVRSLFLDLAGFDAWAERWRAVAPDADGMDRVNPAYIPRNHLVEEALETATAGDLAPSRAAAGRGGIAVRRAAGSGALRRARPRQLR